jgi:arginine exporter protein ArgO
MTWSRQYDAGDCHIVRNDGIFAFDFARPGGASRGLAVDALRCRRWTAGHYGRHNGKYSFLLFVGCGDRRCHSCLPPGFLLIKWAGAAYLVWLGLTMLWPILRGKATAPDMLSAHKPPATGRAFAHGFLIQISNPKNLIAFTAIIPQFVTPGPDIAMQFFILALITIAVEVSILAAYAALSSKASRWGRGKTTVWIEAIAGGWLIAAGAGLAAWRRIEP